MNALGTFGALIVVAQLAMLGLTFAPMSVWRWIDRRSSYTASFLWGYSHLFGPRLHAGEVKPWHQENA